MCYSTVTASSAANIDLNGNIYGDLVQFAATGTCVIKPYP